jgi:hypothetical protein
MRRSLLVCLLLAACAADPAGVTPPPLAVAPRPERLIALHVRHLTTDAMRRGGTIGRYVWSLDCAPPGDPVYWTGGERYTRGGSFAARVRESLRDAGFMADAAEERDARYTLAGDVRSVSLTLCRRIHWLTGTDRGTSGEGVVTVAWTLRDRRADRIAASVTTQGTATLADGVPDGDAALLEQAVSAAAAKLAADPAFAAVFAGPEGAPAPVAAPPESDGDDPDRVRVRVGQRVRAEAGGRRIEGTVAGRSRDRDAGRTVVLIDFGGKEPAVGAAVADERGRAVGRALAPGPRANAAWTGLTPVIPEPADGIDPSPLPPT